MDRGIVEIESIEDLAIFCNKLIESGSALFSVVKKQNIWIVTFSGGY